MATVEQEPETAFCPECGESINRRADVCPECGVTQPDTTKEGDRQKRAKQFITAGIGLGVLAILFLPIVFGPLAALCGVLALFYGRPMAGAGVVAWGLIATVIGWILGIIGLALL